MSITVETLNQANQKSRTTRRPSHAFQITTKPWQIQPMLIAPVLPGETLKNLLLQSRVYTDPVANSMIGWWQEYYFFYVKHRDLVGRDDFTAMALDPSKDMSAYDTAANVKTYHGGAGLDWVQECMERVVDQYFRNEGEAWDDHLIDGMPAASINQQTVLDSAHNVANENQYDEDLTSTTPGVGDGTAAVNVSEIELAMQQWQFLTQNNLTEQSYEEYLQTFGVRPSTVDLHKPELVRYVRDWTYPTNTIDPSDGAPTAACSWKTAERADKDRYFKEPGFIFGVSVTRPKVYLENQKGSVSELMNDAYSWLPAVLTNDARVSLKEVAATTAPLNINTTGYWVDLRDLLMYGEQFVNFAMSTTEAGMVALPTAGLQKRYPTLAMADLLFNDQVGTLQEIHSDGVVSLGIKTMQQDTSRTV